MVDRGGFDRDLHRYLDGEMHGELDPEEREAADQLVAAVAQYGESLRTPGPEVDRAVMAAISTPHVEPVSPTGITWLFRPHTFRLRPVWLAAAAAAALLLWWAPSPRSSPLSRGPDVGREISSDTLYVRFEVFAPQATEVTLAGSFNGWAPDGIAMLPSTGEGAWAVTVPLPVGKHEYLFHVDGEWIPDPEAYAQVDDGFGSRNSVIVVGPRGVLRS